jgi:hypothetical protein
MAAISPLTAHADPTDTPLQLGSLDDCIRQHPGLNSNQLKLLIAESRENGLAEHIYRPRGTRGPVYIDLNGFSTWLRETAREVA